jgi:hypothetical protein
MRALLLAALAAVATTSAYAEDRPAINLDLNRTNGIEVKLRPIQSLPALVIPRVVVPGGDCSAARKRSSQNARGLVQPLGKLPEGRIEEAAPHSLEACLLPAA